MFSQGPDLAKQQAEQFVAEALSAAILLERCPKSLIEARTTCCCSCLLTVGSVACSMLRGCTTVMCRTAVRWLHASLRLLAQGVQLAASHDSTHG